MAARMNVLWDETKSDVLKMLECPICFEGPMVQPIHQCETGHSICSRCKIKMVRSEMDKCGVCTKMFTGTRNFVAENIAKSLKFYCRYKEQGCAEIESRHELKLHECYCSYRPVFCNDNRRTPCMNNPVNVGDLLSHLQNIHGCPLIGDSYSEGAFTLFQSRLLDTTPGDMWTNHLKLYGKDFIYQTRFDQHNVHWWVYLIGTSEEAKKYQYELTILPTKESLRNQNVEIKYKLPVQSMHTNFEKLLWAGGHASYPKAFLMPLSIIEGTNLSHQVWKWKIVLKIIEGKENSVAESENV